MIIDYLSESAFTDLDVDVCIVGAGAAGIAIARRFIGTSITVCLIEGGGLTGEESSQILYEGTTIGDPVLHAGTSRMRVFGGSCNLWGGGCIPLHSQDMIQRDWVPHSGWPITHTELQPWYQSAKTYCKLDDQRLADGAFDASVTYPPLSFDDDTLINPIFARSPILFGKAYRTEMESAKNITLLVHANLIGLEAAENGSSVRSAKIGTINGQRSQVRARQFVLACGGIENARVLLLSDSVACNGLGNDRDLVGRYFMDHPSGSMGTVTSDDSTRLTRAYDRSPNTGASHAFPEIALSHTFQRNHHILNGRVHPFALEDAVPKGLRALRELRAARRPAIEDENTRLEERLCAALRNGPSNANGSSDSHATKAMLALRVALGSGDIAKAFINKMRHKPTVSSRSVELIGYFEQAPNPDSRITLSQERDALNLRKVCVDWRLTELDRHTYRTAARLFGAQLSAACKGSFTLTPWLHDAQSMRSEVHTTAHHLGTTRMAESAQFGVVDTDCRVYGIDNLYVAGSSVFPTGGWAFPTLTVVALGLRLAEHLHVRLRSDALCEVA